METNLAAPGRRPPAQTTRVARLNSRHVQPAARRPENPGRRATNRATANDSRGARIACRYRRRFRACHDRGRQEVPGQQRSDHRRSRGREDVEQAGCCLAGVVQEDFRALAFPGGSGLRRGRVAHRSRFDQGCLRSRGGGAGFLGLRPKLLFEGHVFWRLLRDSGKDAATLAHGNEDILFEKWTSAHYRGGLAESTERLERAGSSIPLPQAGRHHGDSSRSWA